MHPGQGLYTCEAKLCQHQKRHIREKLSRKDKGRPSFVKNCTVHMTQRTFTCREGGKDFPASTGPLQHRPPHGVGKPHGDIADGEAFQNGQSDYKCTQCGKAFSHKHTLVDHEKIYTGEKLYENRECGKAFLRKSHHEQHQKVNTEPGLYEHSECGVFFTEISGLSDHQRIHTRPRPFECSLP